MAVQTMNIVPTAECVFVHLSEIDTKLAAAAANRSRKRRTVVVIAVLLGGQQWII